MKHGPMHRVLVTLVLCFLASSNGWTSYPQTLNPRPRMHATCLCTSSLHFSSATDASAFKKQSSRADFVSGHAQHLQSNSMTVQRRRVR